jgi:hypothetical protein
MTILNIQLIKDTQKNIDKIQEKNFEIEKKLEGLLITHDNLLDLCETFPLALIGVHIPKDSELSEKSERLYSFDSEHNQFITLIPVLKIYANENFIILSPGYSELTQYFLNDLDLSILTIEQNNWQVAKDYYLMLKKFKANHFTLNNSNKPLFLENIPDSQNWTSAHPTEKVYGAFNIISAQSLLTWGVKYLTPHY